MSTGEKRERRPHVGTGEASVVVGQASPVQTAGLRPLRPGPEVVERPVRRTFTAEFKRRVVEEAAACREPGEVGAVLRRHGLYSSHLVTWRRQWKAGALAGLAPRKRGRKAPATNPLAAQVAKLEREKGARGAAPQAGGDDHRVPKKSLGVAGNPPEAPRQRRERLMAATAELAAVVGTAPACQALAVPRATLYRHRGRGGDAGSRPSTARRPSPRALGPEERRAVLDALHAERSVDQAPREVYATLLDEGRYLCSVPTMYRLLRAEGEVRDRRDQLRHPAYRKPELLATAPNQVWSWDITTDSSYCCAGQERL